MLRRAQIWIPRRSYVTIGPKPITRHVLSSLRADELTSSDFVWLAGRRTLLVYFSHDPSELALRLSYDSTRAGSFPAHAAGYLYYHPPPPYAPLAGSLRLRVNSNNARGSDLLLPNGAPWQIILPQLTNNKLCSGALQKLLTSNLITPSVVGSCRALFHAKSIRPQNLLFHLGQTFPLSMTQAELKIRTVGRDSLGLFVKQRLFGDPAPQYPYKGSVLARFELSADQTRVFIRIVEEIVPVKCIEPGYDGRVVMPRAGQLLTYKYDGVVNPWSIRVEEDSHSAAALRLLIDQQKQLH
ncbi:hypothetical protein FB45DRAFT_183543 [Roridomyces roridus]|uniref:Uncharacterized protein n=1 Tax=Roridomyces roridus TaxID=1738132 RepID=A0AAD7CEA4_9AGAR|nr:hypothetical protein FB45DRAFT_183543 [Roridomyces roridus]